MTDSKTQLTVFRALQPPLFNGLAEGAWSSRQERVGLGVRQLFPTALRVFVLGPPQREVVARYGAPLVRRAAPVPARGMPVSGLCTEC